MSVKKGIRSFFMSLAIFSVIAGMIVGLMALVVKIAMYPDGVGYWILGLALLILFIKDAWSGR